MNKLIWCTAAAALLGSVGLFALPASAATFTGPVAPGAGCGGGPGIGGFDGCEYNDSAIIAKNEYDDGVFGAQELNTAVFPTINGGEFTVDFDAGSDSSGTWSYNPGAGDPTVITAYTIFAAATNYTFDWNMDGIDYTDIPWATPTGQALSHIAWFDTDNGTTVVPLPAALPLMIGALGGFGFLGWRRRRA